MEKDKKYIRIPVKETALNTYQCPCGRSGIICCEVYETGLDDADPDWGRYKEEYLFSPDDPCFRKYSIVRLDSSKKEFVLKVKE